MDFKNLTPKQLSLFTATILSIIVGFGMWLIHPDIVEVLVSTLIFLVLSYALILYTLQKFIYRKIKLIYKFIYQTKASKREETYYKYILPQKSIDEVRADVEKWAEQRMGEIDLLRANEAYRKEFLQNLAHEIKTPIFALQGYLELLQGGAAEDETMRERFLSKSEKNVDRLVNLANDIDIISKLESGEIPLNKEVFSIRNLVKEVIESLYIKATAKHIKCAIKNEDHFSYSVFADKERIRQVLINLIENGIKYGKEHGKVMIGIYNVDEATVLIEVSDDGMGIAEEHLSRVFERFYRTDRARNRQVGGSGLGLAICKHIVEAHNQSIHVRSKVDVGTTIGFTLPVGNKV